MQNEFSHAVSLLREAQSAVAEEWRDREESTDFDAKASVEKRVDWWRREKLAPSISALLGVAVFRDSPDKPEVLAVGYTYPS